ncbi:hypothetical protein PybrP1_003707 [[Pythium] brassicae (nom. inval.)]|nr:hypothetical protein PybrP1_003707 [[Pythium] brassicae (nom. inval.)]
MKLFQLTLPNEQHGAVVSVLQDELQLANVTSVEARTSSIVTFRVEDEEMQAILTRLQRLGVGVQFGFCDVMSLTPGTTMSKRAAPGTKKTRRVARILARSTDVGTAVPVAEMYAHIEANSTLSRDSVGMLLISSAIAGIGLAGDSGTYIVASMLLSPLMIITLLLGMVIGALLSPYAAALNWPTDEMRARGQAIQLLFGAVVAALSGAGVALAESNANISSVVGTAIAAALLPPTVNCGICFSYVLVGQYFVADDVIGEEQRLVFYEIAVGSAMLVWINVVFIYLTAVFVFKAKKVGEFQLIRKVDEGAWTNLPRVQRSPRAARPHARVERADSANSVTSSQGLLDLDDVRSDATLGPDSGADTDTDADAAPDLPVSPLRRRQRPPSIFIQDNDDSAGDRVNQV